MSYIARFDPIWFSLALVLLVPALLACISRCCLSRSSRKRLLALVPADRRGQLEEDLNLKDEYEVHLETLDTQLRLGSVICLTIARALLLESEETGAGVLAAVLVLAVEWVVLVFVLFRIGAQVIARLAAEAWTVRALTAVRWLYRVTDPLRSFESGLVKVVSFLLGARDPDRSSADIVEEEILEAVEEGQREGILQSRDIDMIESIISYGEVEVSEVMTPRTEMVALDLEAPLEENLEQVIECGHSRIPVYRGTKDGIVGILYVKDLQKFWIRKEPIELESVVRAHSYVPIHAKIGELLHDFRRHRQHLAIVQDEHGGTAGLVTIEDILEEIVGEISDEYESDEALLKRVGVGLVEVDGAIHIDDLNESLGLEMPEGDTYDTLGGFVFESIGRIPEKGLIHEVRGVRIEVAEVDDRRIRRLRLHLPSRLGAKVGPGAPDADVEHIDGSDARST